MKRPVYTILNIIYQVLICWLLIVLGKNVNDMIIPDNWIIFFGRVGTELFVLIAEGELLIAIIYMINGAALSGTTDGYTQKYLVNKTAILHSIITSVFIIVVIFAKI